MVVVPLVGGVIKESRCVETNTPV